MSNESTLRFSCARPCMHVYVRAHKHRGTNLSDILFLQWVVWPCSHFSTDTCMPEVLVAMLGITDVAGGEAMTAIHERHGCTIVSGG